MRLIDADALASALNNGRLEEQTGRAVPFNAGVAFALTMVEYAQTIDAILVVRCKDCVSFRYSDMGVDNGITYCASMGIEMQPTDFCSYGERKDNE